MDQKTNLDLSLDCLDSEKWGIIMMCFNWISVAIPYFTNTFTEMYPSIALNIIVKYMLRNPELTKDSSNIMNIIVSVFLIVFKFETTDFIDIDQLILIFPKSRLTKQKIILKEQEILTCINYEIIPKNTDTLWKRFKLFESILQKQGSQCSFFLINSNMDEDEKERNLILNNKCVIPNQKGFNR